MKRMGNSGQVVAWALAFGFVACTGYLNDDFLLPDEGAAGSDSSNAGAGGRTKGGRGTAGAGGASNSSKGGGGAEGGQDDPAGNEGGSAGAPAPGTGGLNGSGGNPVGAGGSLGLGGKISGTGGAMGTGGTPGTGGKPGTGGNPGTGGTPGTGGNPGTGGSNVPDPPGPPAGSPSGWASRYWDCCKPACGWKDKAQRPMKTCTSSNASQSNVDAQSSCNGGDSFMCWNAAPWAVSPTLAYGFAAASGGDFSCGKCYLLAFTGQGHDGNNPNVGGLKGKKMIVQVTNTGGDVGGGQFDILIPGGGVGQFDACSRQWGVAKDQLGNQYGGFAAACSNQNSCTKNKCQSVFGSKPDLLAGCNWFVDWYGGADNPTFNYAPIDCPQAIRDRSGM